MGNELGVEFESIVVGMFKPFEEAYSFRRVASPEIPFRKVTWLTYVNEEMKIDLFYDHNWSYEITVLFSLPGDNDRNADIWNMLYSAMIDTDDLPGLTIVKRDVLHNLMGILAAKMGKLLKKMAEDPGFLRKVIENR